MVIAIGPGFVDYAQPVFTRCVQIVRQSLIEYQTFAANPAQFDEPDKTFLIVSLDLLSGLTQGLNTSITPLYQSSDPPVLSLLAMCLQVRYSCDSLGLALIPSNRRRDSILSHQYDNHRMRYSEIPLYPVSRFFAPF